MASQKTSVFPNTSTTGVGGQNALEEKTPNKKRVIVVLKKITTPQPLPKSSQNSAKSSAPSSAQSSAKNFETSSKSSSRPRPEELQKYNDDEDDEYDDYADDEDSVDDDDFSLNQTDVCQRCRNDGYYTCRCHQYDDYF